MDAESISSEVAFRVSRSSGPGGQHAQKSSTRVEALFDVEASAGLTEAERRRVLERLGPVVRAVAQDERSPRAAPRGGSRPPRAPADAADGRLARAAARAEAAAVPDEAPAPPAGRVAATRP
jgi:hypothetical protein